MIDATAARYPDTPRAVIARVVTEEYDLLDETKIRTYIPTLVEHTAKDRLHRRARCLAGFGVTQVSDHVRGMSAQVWRASGVVLR